MALATACGSSAPPQGTGEQKGTYGVSWLLTVSRQAGGTVVTKDGRIACGTAPGATRCGPVSYGWNETATLVATPDAGFMFGTWAGDCSGRTAVDGEWVCVLDTKTTGADKYVVPVFGEAGRSAHGNFLDHNVHGPAFLDWKAGKPDTFDCAYCHGASYAGLGLAPSCNACHEQTGYPSWQTNCNFCHKAPPPPPHPAVTGGLADCAVCHGTTVDSSGSLIPNGTHMNGKVEGGHAPGYASPAVHGRDFFEYTGGNAGLACTACHGTAYDRPIVDGTDSCNSCHASNGWTGWQTNCSFCHGVKDATTQAGYALGDHPTWSSPPDALSQRLTGVAATDRTGAHAIHLTGSAYARAFTCDACHTVPTTVSHISGRDVRAAVALKAPGQAADPDPAGYDPATRTCATACHGAGRSPAWTVTGIACNGCHAVPPATSAHVGLDGSDLKLCAGCHPDTIGAGGQILIPGAHINGTVDKVDGHAAGFATNSVHGPLFLDAISGVSGAPNCAACHTGYSNCGGCHSSTASGAWVSWQTNCTFCHGTRTPGYTPDLLVNAAPPDAVSQRLTGAPDFARTGVHGAHVVQDTTYSPFGCAACHPVPTNFDHVSAERRAAVAITAAGAFPGLSPAEQGALPNPLATYSLPDGTCTAYCHGATMQGGLRTLVYWDDEPIGDCTSCHGSPPKTGRIVLYAASTSPTCRRSPGCSLHELHTAINSSCDNCHTGSAPANGAKKHVSGKADVVYRAGLTATWDGTAGTCTSTCHATPTTVKTWR